MRERFALYTRFADPAFGGVSEAHLASVRDLNQTFSRLLWSAWVSPMHTHLCEISAASRRAPVATYAMEWDEGEQGDRLLSDLFGGRAALGKQIVHFWSPLHCVHTTAEIFLRCRRDFWYPSDDNSVLIIPGRNLRVEYVEERISLHSMGRSA
jgi:hypothetical protein